MRVEVLWIFWANMVEVRWSPGNACYLCVKFWAITPKLLQEECCFFVSGFLMDLHQQKWRGKIYIMRISLLHRNIAIC